MARSLRVSVAREFFRGGWRDEETTARQVSERLSTRGVTGIRGQRVVRDGYKRSSGKVGLCPYRVLAL